MSFAIKYLLIYSIIISFITLTAFGDITLKLGSESVTIQSISDNSVSLHEFMDYYKIGFQWDPMREQISLSKDGLSGELALGNHHALINKKDLLLLSAPPHVIDGIVILPLKDAVSILSRLVPYAEVSYDELKKVVEAKSIRNSTNVFSFSGSDFGESDLNGNFQLKNVVIDPGHGGHDPGATRSGVYEKDIVLEVGLRLANLLKTHSDIKPIMTRSSDIFIPLPDRTSIANRYPPDSTLFISIHCNASRAREGGYGTEAYIFNLDATDNEARALAARENMGEPMDLTRILSHCYHTGTEPYSLDIAQRIRMSISRNVGLDDRGTRRAAFYVLAGTKTPSILLELAYISNSSERAKLQTDSFQQQIAEALFAAIMDFDKATTRSLAKNKAN